MRKVLSMLVMSAFCFATHGQTMTEIDGIFYKLDESASTASVINGYKAGITEVPYAGVINVPATVIFEGTDYTVTSVDASAFEYATCTEVTLPSTCTTIGKYSFDSMPNLVKLDLGGVNDLPGNSIYSCPALNDLYLGYTGGVVGTVGASISSGIRDNLNIHVPEALVSSYQNSSFWKSVKAILAPRQVQVEDLYYEYYPADNTAMVLAPYIIPGNGNPKQIGPTVEIPSTITVDGAGYTVTNLQAGVFYDTPNVTAVKFNEGLKNIEYETFYATAVSEVTFPNSLENLSYNNFYYCTSVTKVTFGTGIRTIGENTFFYCPNMTELGVMAQDPPTLEQGCTGDMFSSYFNKANVTLTVPTGRIDSYKASTYWSGFKEYKEYNVETGIDRMSCDDNVSARYFNLQGIELKNPTPGTICLRAKGNKVDKVVFEAE